MSQPVIVILAGGRGECFWPLSRRHFPKQLLPLLNGRSLLQEAVSRVSGLVDEGRLFVVANRHYTEAVRSQLPMLPANNIIVEPESRNTAAAVGLAALVIRECFGGNPPVVFIPSDLRIYNDQCYRNFIVAALDLCRSGQPVIGGTRPDRPETGFGYIRIGPVSGEIQGIPYHPVLEFKEKPQQEQAEKYVSSGDYLWNAGVFVWKLRDLLEEYKRQLPQLLFGLERLLPQLLWEEEAAREGYRDLPFLSFDEGILEKAAGVTVLVGDYRWDDLGGWNAWAETWPEDLFGNRTKAEHFGMETDHCLIYSPRKPVVTFGVSDLLIIETDDVLMVCHRDHISELKNLIRHLGDSGGEYLL